MPFDTSVLTPEFGWNPVASRYVQTATGKFVPFAQVKNELERVVSLSQANVGALSESLRAGQISLVEWKLAMRQEIKAMQTAAAAAARGGWAQMSQADWGWTGQRIRVQYRYLNNFAAQVASGEQPLNGRLVSRAKLYGQAARTTYEDMRLRNEMLNNGMIEARRILHATESCQGCIDEAGRGWVPIDELAPIGTQECRANCRCTIEFR